MLPDTDAASKVAAEREALDAWAKNRIKKAHLISPDEAVQKGWIAALEDLRVQLVVRSQREAKR